MENLIANVQNKLLQEVAKVQEYVDNNFRFDTTVDLGEYNVGETTVDFSLEMSDVTGWVASYEVSWQSGIYSLYESTCSQGTDVEEVLKKFYGIDS